MVKGLEQVLDIGMGIDSTALAGKQDGIDDGGAFAGMRGSDEEPSLG